LDTPAPSAWRTKSTIAKTLSLSTNKFAGNLLMDDAILMGVLQSIAQLQKKFEGLETEAMARFQPLAQGCPSTKSIVKYENAR
jgi:hypothetical protein